MALLQKLKEKLGFGSGSSGRESGETEVTVERESEPAAESTAADEDEPVGDGTAEPTAEPADEADETDPDAESEGDADDGAVEPEGEADDAEPEGEADDAEPEDEADDAADGDRGPSVEEIKGIGPAYAERLAEIGIETVADLADADAAAVAEGTSVGEKRAATWIGRANEF